MPTDLQDRKRVNRLRREIGETSRQEARRTNINSNTLFAVDMTQESCQLQKERLP